MNAYEVLQVSPKASLDVIRAAWAALIREVHPDSPTPNEKRARELNEAYAVLKNPESRLLLDQQLAVAKIHKTPRRRAPAEPEAPNFPPAYPDPYMGVSQEAIDDAIDEFTQHMKTPPFVRDLVGAFAKTAVKNARRQ